MARSYKKTPIGSHCLGGAQKQFRSQENRAKRIEVRIRLLVGKYEMPHEKEYGNEWDSPRDGKFWFGDMDLEDDDFKRAMRR